MNYYDYEKEAENRLKEMDSIRNRLLFAISLGTAVTLLGTILTMKTPQKVEFSHEYGKEPAIEHNVVDMRTR